MKDFVIKRESWIYKIAEFGGITSWDSSSICEFNWHLFSGIVFILAYIFFGSLILYFTLSPVYYGVMYLINTSNGFFNHELAVVGLTMDLSLLAVFVGFSIFTYLDNNKFYNKNYSSKPTEPSRLQIYLRAVKNKICIKVIYK